MKAAILLGLTVFGVASAQQANPMAMPMSQQMDMKMMRMHMHMPMYFMAKLSGAQEVPAKETKGMGMVSAVMMNNMLIVGGNFSGMSAAVSGAHIHGPADEKSNAGVVFPLASDNKTEGNFGGSYMLTKEQVMDLMMGKWYVNLHTSTNPGGEIRGQLMPMMHKMKWEWMPMDKMMMDHMMDMMPMMNK